MPFYKIYAGLGGGFGGAHYECTEEHDNEKSAVAFAYTLACDIYWMYEGSGIDSFEDFLIEAESEVEEDDFDDFDDYKDALEEWADQAQLNDMEIWLDYWVEETPFLINTDN